MGGLRLDMSLSLSGGASFSPSSLFAASEAGGWYDPSDLSTLFQDSAATTPVTADGDPVGYMADKSGNGNHLTQATAASRPLYKIDANGKPYLLFDGTDDYISKAANIAQPFDRLSAIQQVSFTNADVIFGGAAGSNAGGLYQLDPSPTLQIFASGFAAANGGLAVGSNGVVTERFNGASSSIQVNDNAATTGDVGAGGSDYITLGARPEGGQAANVRIYGFLVREGTLSAGEKVNVKAYLSRLAGL